jgi:hypothetical protein
LNVDFAQTSRHATGAEPLSRRVPERQLPDVTPADAVALTRLVHAAAVVECPAYGPAVLADALRYGDILSVSVALAAHRTDLRSGTFGDDVVTQVALVDTRGVIGRWVIPPPSSASAWLDGVVSRGPGAISAWNPFKTGREWQVLCNIARVALRRIACSCQDQKCGGAAGGQQPAERAPDA